MTHTYLVRRTGVAANASELDAALTRLRLLDEQAPADLEARWLHSYALREAEPDNVSRAVAWVFPNTALKGPVGSKSLGKQLSDRQREPSRRLQGRTKDTSALMLPGGRWTAHDLRRTTATMMAGMGISGDVIDECLNHMIESRVRRTYIRDRRFSEQQKAFDALGRRLAGLLAAPSSASQPGRTTRRTRRVSRVVEPTA